jgi:cytoskeletal protein RodZ
MPLDTGDVEFEKTVLAAAGDELASLRPTPIRLDESQPLGAALAAARRSLDLAVEDIASATRVRTRYVIAIEAFDFDALPARPFVIGYVRAYALALGLDADAVVARFRAEAPPVSDELAAPAGVERRKPLAPRIVAVVAALIVAGVVAWNIWRHAAPAPPRALPMPPASAAPAPAGPVALGAPLPTPPEASTPPAYQTPGLPQAGATTASAAATTPAGAEAESGVPASGAPFVPAGAVYGAPAAAAGGDVILQARSATTLVIRGPGGAVYFARHLAAGESWRAPAIAGLTADAGTPSAVEAYVAGLSHGVLTRPQTPLSSLTAD